MDRFCQLKNLYANVARWADPHPALSKQKDYGIMQKIICNGFAKYCNYFLHPSGLIPFPFGLLIHLALKGI